MKMIDAVETLANAWGPGLIEGGIAKLDIQISIVDGQIRYRYEWERA